MTQIAAVVGLISVISTTINQIEKRGDEAKAAGEATWTGEFKLALAISIIEQVYNATVPVVPFEQIKPTIISTINTLVAVYRAIGHFTKK